jgi:hypothetical protein
MKNKIESTLIKDAEYGVDSRYASDKVKEKDSVYLMEARLNRIKKISNEDIKRAKLLQLKLKMDDFIKNPVYNHEKYFAQFIENYIDIIYSRRNAFAIDIGISPISLSHLLNNHRNPQEEFILKLMVHSEFVFKNICEFNSNIWFQIFYLEKIVETMSNQKKWRPAIEKQINLTITI